MGQISSDLRKRFQDCGVEGEKGTVSYRRSKANGYELRFLNFIEKLEIFDGTLRKEKYQ